MRAIFNWGVVGVLQAVLSILCAHTEFDSMNLGSYLSQRRHQFSPVYSHINCIRCGP